ncbi:hypothetical protein EPO34_03205 [Patescibacteria group bacterium]|nr:MAG: hypothetical protein EPO34_03205 [Patescibacteria group bacterium]
MYIDVSFGDGPVVISVPHDGATRVVGALQRAETLRWERECGPDARDVGTWEVADACVKELSELGISASRIASALHRSHMDANRAPGQEPFVDGFEATYHLFHHHLHEAIRRSVAVNGRCLVVDLHSFIASPGPETYDFVLGSDGHRTCPGKSDLFVARVLKERYRVVFSPDSRLGVTGIYRGGWIVRSIAKEWNGQRVDALQIEINRLLYPDVSSSEIASFLARAIHCSLQDI